jgi:hypothetical protein
VLLGASAEETPNAVHAGRTDALQVLEALATEAEVALVPQMCQFAIQGTAQAFRIDLVKELCDPHDGTLIFIGIEAGMRSPNAFGGIAMAPVAAQEGNGMFAMIARRGDKLIEDVTALFLGRLRITLPQFVEILCRGFRMTHKEDS